MSEISKRALVALGVAAVVLAFVVVLVLAPVALASAPISVTIDDYSDFYAPGEAVYYTAVLTNESGSPISGVAVSLGLPAPADATASSWTCTYDGASGSLPSEGTGDISGTVDLDAGGSVQFDILCQTLPEATGDLTATFTAQIPDGQTFPGGVQQSATDTDVPGVVTTIVPVEPGPLTLTKWDGVEVYEPGATVVYTIIVSNVGSDPLTGIVLSDKLPEQIDVANATWNASVDQAICAPLTGSGDVSATVDLEPGGSVTIDVTCPVLPDALGSMTNTVGATLQDGSEYWADDTDANPADTTDTVTDEEDYGPTTTSGEEPQENSAGSTPSKIESGRGGHPAPGPGVWVIGGLALAAACGLAWSRTRPLRRRG